MKTKKQKIMKNKSSITKKARYFLYALLASFLLIFIHGCCGGGCGSSCNTAGMAGNSNDNTHRIEGRSLIKDKGKTEPGRIVFIEQLEVDPFENPKRFVLFRVDSIEFIMTNNATIRLHN